jgi:hypothetical protein
MHNKFTNTLHSQLDSHQTCMGLMRSVCLSRGAYCKDAGPLTSSGPNSTGSETTTIYLVTWINKSMPCLDPQTPQDGVLTNKTAAIQGFVEANMLETHSRARGFFYPSTHEVPKYYVCMTRFPRVSFRYRNPQTHPGITFSRGPHLHMRLQLWLAETPASGLGRTNPAFQYYSTPNTSVQYQDICASFYDEA